MATVGVHPVDVSAHGPGDSLAEDKRAQSGEEVGHDEEMDEVPVSSGAGPREDASSEGQEDDDESLTDRVRVRSRKVRAPVILDESDESEDEEDYSPEADATSTKSPAANARGKASQQEGLAGDDNSEDEHDLEMAYKAETKKRVKNAKRANQVDAPKTPPATGEHEEGTEKAKARRREDAEALGCFDITVWFERDRQRVFGQPKRHACVRSVRVSELQGRQQQLRSGAGGKVTNANAAAVAERKALGPPSVLDGRPGDEFMLAVELGAKVVPVADLWGFRSWPASCQNKEGTVVATSTHCCKIKGHPGLVAFVGPTLQSEASGVTNGAAEAAKGEVPRFAKFVTEVLSGSGPGVQPKCQDCAAKAERQKEADEARKRKADEALEKENKRLKSSESILMRQRDVEKEEKERVMREMKNLQKELKAAKEEMAKKKKESAEKANLEARLREAERKAEQSEKLRREAEQKGKDAAAAKFEAERKKMEAKHKEELRKAASSSASMAEKERAWEAERTKLLCMLQQAQEDASKKADDMMAGEREAFRQEKSQLEELLREERQKARANAGSAECKNCPMCLKRAQEDEPMPTRPLGLDELRERARQAGELENLLRAELKRAHDEWKKRDAEMRKKAAEDERRKKAEDRVRSQQEQRRKRDEEQRKFQEQMRRMAEERRRAEEQEAKRKAEEQRRQEEEARRIREAQERARKAAQEADAKKQSSEAELERQYLQKCAGTDCFVNYDKYESAINQLKNSTGALTKLSFFNIPWPPPNNPLFLLPNDAPATKKKKLKTALLFWHTDKFNAICASRLLPEHKEAIEAKVKRTVQAVIEARASLG